MSGFLFSTPKTFPKTFPGALCAMSLTCLMLAGCSGGLFGASRTDSFSVFNYPPLTTPPDLFLRPPVETRPASDVAAATESALGLEEEAGEAGEAGEEGEAQKTKPLTPGGAALLELLNIDASPEPGSET